MDWNRQEAKEKNQSESDGKGGDCRFNVCWLRYAPEAHDLHAIPKLCAVCVVVSLRVWTDALTYSDASGLCVCVCVCVCVCLCVCMCESACMGTSARLPRHIHSPGSALRPRRTALERLHLAPWGHAPPRWWSPHGRGCQWCWSVRPSTCSTWLRTGWWCPSPSPSPCCPS